MIYFFVLLLVVQHFYPTQLISFFLCLLFTLEIVSIVNAIYTRKIIRIECKHIASDYHSGNDIDLIFVGHSKHLISPIQLKIRVNNLHFKTERYNDFSSITFNENKYVWRYPLTKIGTYQVKLEGIVVRDFFHVLKFKKKINDSFRFNVYPTPKRVTKRDVITEIVQDENDSENEIGQDYTEVYGFHEYREGESFAHVHPLLSAKFDKYIMKEGSDNQKSVYIYPLSKSITFDKLSQHLCKIYQLFITVVLEREDYFYIRYDNEDIPIYSHYELYSIINRLYEEYLV